MKSYFRFSVNALLAFCIAVLSACSTEEELSSSTMSPADNMETMSGVSSDLWIEVAVGTSPPGNDCDLENPSTCGPCAGVCIRFHKGKKPKASFTNADYNAGFRLTTGDLLSSTQYRMYFNLGEHVEDSSLMVQIDGDLPFESNLAADFGMSSIVVDSGSYQAYALNPIHTQGFDAYVDLNVVTTP